MCGWTEAKKEEKRVLMSKTRTRVEAKKHECGQKKPILYCKLVHI